MGEVVRVDTPNFLLVMDRELYVLRWREATTATIGQLAKILGERCEAIPRPLIYVVILGRDTVPANRKLREEMMKRLAAYQSQLQMTRILVMGSGLRVSMIRSGLIAMAFAAAKLGKPFQVDGSPEAMTEVLAGATKREPQALLERFVAEGLVYRDELAS